jgi:type IV pilus assembly protein PilQ
MRRLLVIFILMLVCTGTVIAARDPFQESSLQNGNNITSSAAALSDVLIPIHYGNAEDVEKLLTAKDSSFLSPEGNINVDKRTNSIWIEDEKDRLNKIRRFIKNIDVPVKQILIEARVVNVDENFTRELGLEFGTTKETENKTIDGLTMDLPSASTDIGHFSFTLAKLNSNTLLDMELSALESEGHGKVISRPKLITLDREPAYIDSGESIPYQERTSYGNTNIAFKKAVLALKVTPVIVSPNKVLLYINLNQDKVSAFNVKGIPAIDTQEIKTQVLVNNKQTVVLGGIYEQNNGDVITKIPVLSSIPIVGVLFRHKKSETKRKELLIFITPQIIY